MKLLTLLVAIFTAPWLPYVFIEAMELQAHIDARNAAMERIARMGR
jgi:hypothetical protein